MNSKLKEIIFKKLDSDLSHVEIILHTDESIWFIDREETYWYLEFEKSGNLWWRLPFFSKFFILFSIERSEYESIISEWVEYVLNRKVVSTCPVRNQNFPMVEYVLNRKVVSTAIMEGAYSSAVENVLNRKVVTSQCRPMRSNRLMEEILNEVLNNNI